VAWPSARLAAPAAAGRPEARAAQPRWRPGGGSRPGAATRRLAARLAAPVARGAAPAAGLARRHAVAVAHGAAPAAGPARRHAVAAARRPRPALFTSL